MINKEIMPKKKIILELEERYFSKKDLSEATYNHLENNGHSCELLNVDTIIIGGYKYSLQEWNINMMVPLQRVILKLIK